jgi:hypothetical protein
VASEREADVAAAGKMLSRIYDNNVFPDLGVTWGLYPNNLGHDAFPGCFRCHDDEHKTAAGKTITQDCSVCHEAVATEESSPELLKTLGLDARIASSRSAPIAARYGWAGVGHSGRRASICDRGRRDPGGVKSSPTAAGALRPARRRS